MTDTTQAEDRFNPPLALGCLALSAVLLLLAVLVGVWAWDAFIRPDPNPPGPVDPDDDDDWRPPHVDDDLETAAAEALEQVEDEIRRCKREARDERKLRRILPDRIHAAAFEPLDDILHEAAEEEFADVFQALAQGFRRGANQTRDGPVKRYGESLGRNFGKASTAAEYGDDEKALHQMLAEANHAALDRLVEQICNGPRDDANPFTGYRIDQEARDALRATSTPLPVRFNTQYRAPAEMDPRPWHRIEDQGQMGSCQGHALSSVCELAAKINFAELVAQSRCKDRQKSSRCVEQIGRLGKMFADAFRRKDDKEIQFSPLFAYYASQKRDGILGQDIGSTLAGGLASAKEDGSCPEDVMPYRLPYTGQFAKGAFEAAKGFKIRRHTVCESYDDVFQFLASGQGGVEIGIRWGDGMTPRNGVIEQFAPGGGGHAVCFLGYSRRKDRQGRNYLWMANSWSRQWGNDGWAEVAPAAVDQMCRHQDTVMLGLSDMAVARPRDVSWIGKDSVFAEGAEQPAPRFTRRALADMRRNWKGSVL